MNHAQPSIADPSPAHCWWLWPAVAMVAAVFFFLEHNISISQFESYSPWTDSEGSLETGHNAAKGAALLLMGLFGAHLAVRPGGRPLRVGGWLPPLVCGYWAWLMASVCWSINPDMSARRLMTLGCFLLAAIGFARHLRLRDIAVIAVGVEAAYLLLGIGAEVALGTFRPWSADYRFAGTIHPNAQGVQMGILCLALFCLARYGDRHRRRCSRPPVAALWVGFAVALGFLLLSRSRASLASLSVAIGAVWFASASARARLMAALAAGLMVTAAALVATNSDGGANGLMGAAMMGRQEQSEGLTGRVPLWNELAGYVHARPLQGYGYQAFWSDKHIDAISDSLDWTLRESHNGYLETALSVGLVGGVILLTVVLVGLVQAAAVYRATNDPGMAFLVGMLVFCMADACLESGVPNFAALLVEIGLAQLVLSRAGATAIAQRSPATTSGPVSHPSGA
ncbi:MAG: O-antigen ligase family protein [Thermoguttaceae bacterium]